MNGQIIGVLSDSLRSRQTPADACENTVRNILKTLVVVYIVASVSFPVLSLDTKCYKYLIIHGDVQQSL